MGWEPIAEQVCLHPHKGCTRAKDPLWVCKPLGELNLKAATTMGWEPIVEQFAFTARKTAVCGCSSCGVMDPQGLHTLRSSEPQGESQFRRGCTWLFPCGTSAPAG